jgi:WXG100 family type VII secretion target
MAGTEVLTGKMREVAQSVEDIVGRYNTSVEKTYQIGGEIDAMWEGDANQKFMNIMSDDREKFNAMTKMLTEYVNALRQDADIYEKAENDVLDVLNANKIRA